MKLDCCSQQGFCETFKRELWSRIWELAHGINCTDAEHQKMRDQLLAAIPKAPQSLRNVVKRVDGKAIRKQQKRIKGKSGGCGCKKRHQ